MPKSPSVRVTPKMPLTKRGKKAQVTDSYMGRSLEGRGNRPTPTAEKMRERKSR